MLNIYKIWEFLAGLKAKILTVSGTGGNGYIDVTQQSSSPVAPSVGFSRLYPKADGNFYRKDPSGIESVVGSGAGGGGATNYLAKWTDCSAPIDTLDSTLTFTVGVSTRANPTLWGHSADVNLVPLKITTGNLSGGSSYQLTPLSDAVGSVQTPLFQLEKIDQGGKPLTLSLALSGVNASGDYDVVLDRYNSSYVYQGSIPFVGNMSTGSPVSAKLPTGTTRFTSFAIATGAATDFFAIRYRRLNAASAASVSVLIDEMAFGAQQASLVPAGQKEYVAGNTYNGVALTVTGNNSFTLNRGVFIPYRTPDGAYRLRGTVTANAQLASSMQTISIAGIVAKNIVGFNQACFATSLSGVMSSGAGYTTPGQNILTFFFPSASAAIPTYFFDVELDGPTTWADPDSSQYLSNPNITFDMAGSIQAYAGAKAPTGWALCDGTVRNKGDYSDLYANIGDTWNTCTDPIAGTAYTDAHATKPRTASQFRLPDLRDVFLRGVGGANVAGVTTTLGGYQADLTAPNALTGTAAGQSYSGNSGSVSGGGHGHSYSRAIGRSGSSTGTLYPGNYNMDYDYPGVGGDGSHGHTVAISHDHGASSVSFGVTGASETRPDNVGVNYIIRLYNSGLAAGVCPIDKSNISGFNAGDTVYGSGGIMAALPGNATTTRKFLRQVGDGTTPAAPAWDVLTSADIVGRTDGVAPGAGQIGQTIEANGAATCNVATGNTICTVTLTAGVWLVSAVANHDSNANTSGLDAKLNIKGVVGSGLPQTRMIQSNPITTFGAATFLPRILVIASGDANKTVALFAKALGSDTDVWGYLTAVRVA